MDYYEECLILYGDTRSKRIAHARSIGTHTKAEWEGMKNIHGYVCAKCDSEVIGGHPTKDHIQPIMYGGSDAIENIQPLCRQCNSGKFDWIDYRIPWKRKLKRWLHQEGLE